MSDIIFVKTFTKSEFLCQNSYIKKEKMATLANLRQKSVNVKVSQKSQTTCVYIAHKLIQTCSSQITLREFRIQPKISLYG